LTIKGYRPLRANLKGKSPLARKSWNQPVPPTESGNWGRRGEEESSFSLGKRKRSTGPIILLYEAKLYKEVQKGRRKGRKPEKKHRSFEHFIGKMIRHLQKGGKQEDIMGPGMRGLSSKINS